ncbi:MAG: hypothetical protein IIA14_08105 [SAR324 cluster bacterium]|nr:hypothetical protein [SAR324 cluster bacterium]
MALATHIILNPAANRHRTGRLWQTFQRQCLRELAPAEVTIAETAEEAEEAARASVLKGYRKIISVGGNEVLNGVVNGVMRLAEEQRKALQIGTLSIARPEDWSRTLDLPRKFLYQLEVLKAGHTMPFDVGRVDCVDAHGKPISRHFLNGSGFGLGPGLKHEWAQSGKTFPESVFGILRMLGVYALARGPRIKLEGEAGLIFEGPLAQAFVMGGRFYTALGEVAPRADPADGALDVVWVGSSSPLELISHFSALVFQRRGGGQRLGRALEAVVRASSQDGPVYLEVDGLPLGRLPAIFSLEPRALPVIVPLVGAQIKKPVFARLPDLRNGEFVANRKTASGF